MSGLFSLIALLILLGLVALFVKVILPGLIKGQIALPYQKEAFLFTPAERSFLAVLEPALGNQFRVLGKVRVADVIRVKPGLSGSARQQAPFTLVRTVVQVRENAPNRKVYC